MTESPVDPAHDDHGDDPEEGAGQTTGQRTGATGENPDGSHDQDAEPPTAP
jgi:hypothetical protein